MLCSQKIIAQIAAFISYILCVFFLIEYPM